MKNSFVIYPLLLPILIACSSIKSEKSPQAIINWQSLEGISRLDESKYKVDFYKLANHYESQHNKIFCGPASAAIVLNAIRVRSGTLQLPIDPSLLTQSDLKYLNSKTWTPFFQRYTQNNIFERSPKSRSQVLGEVLQDENGKILLDPKGQARKDRGFQIQQLAALLKAHRLKTKVRIVDHTQDIQNIKKEIILNLKTRDDYVLVNYKRSILQQPGGGHISPLGAYHKASDSFLIMDVNPNKADWVWVSADLLIRAMHSFDTVQNRGYLLIKEGVQ